MARWPDRMPALIENAIQIDRRSSLSPDETMGRYLTGEGRPVVVTDAQESWKAPKLWSLEYFKKHYSSEALIASDRAPLRLEDNPRMKTLRTTLGEFIDYMNQPDHPFAAQERDCPFYGNSWSPFVEHERLRSHISRPYFVPDDIPDGDAAPEYARLDRSFTKIFLGPAGTVTRLHNDTYHTHAWLSQVQGSKQFVLFPPSQAHLIHAGEGVVCPQQDSPRCHTACAQSWLDPLAPDYERFPRARQATAYVAVCSPGDTLLVPSDWFHYAVALTPSITLMRNFMNAANAQAFFDVWNRNEARGGGDHSRPTPPLISRTPVPPPVLPPLRDPTGTTKPLQTLPPSRPAAPATPLNSQPPLPVPSPRAVVCGASSASGAVMGGIAEPANAARAVERDVAVNAPLGSATTLCGGRTVRRFGAGARPPVRPAHEITRDLMSPALETARAQNGILRVAIEPCDGPCGRRAGTGWAWRGSRRSRRANGVS